MNWKYILKYNVLINNVSVSFILESLIAATVVAVSQSRARRDFCLQEFSRETLGARLRDCQDIV